MYTHMCTSYPLYLHIERLDRPLLESMKTYHKYLAVEWHFTPTLKRNSVSEINFKKIRALKLP